MSYLTRYPYSASLETNCCSVGGRYSTYVELLSCFCDALIIHLTQFYVPLLYTEANRCSDKSLSLWTYPLFVAADAVTTWSHTILDGWIVSSSCCFLISCFLAFQSQSPTPQTGEESTPTSSPFSYYGKGKGTKGTVSNVWCFYYWGDKWLFSPRSCSNVSVVHCQLVVSFWIVWFLFLALLQWTTKSPSQAPTASPITPDPTKVSNVTVLLL